MKKKIFLKKKKHYINNLKMKNLRMSNQNRKLKN